MNNPLTPDQQAMLATWQRFLASLPSDIELIPVSEIFGQEREAEQIGRVRQLAALSRPDPDFAEGFLRFVVREVVCHHESFAR